MLSKALMGAACTFFLTGAANACEFSEEWMSRSSLAEMTSCFEPEFLYQRSDDLGTILHLAIRADVDPVVIDLIRQELGDTWEDIVGRIDDSGKTALHLAAELSDDGTIITRLLLHGANPDPTLDYLGRWVWPDRGTTPLHLAAERPDGLPVVMALLAGGADPDWRDARDSRTPLMIAAQNASDTEVIAALLQADASNLGARNQAGLTALHIAAASERPLLPVLRLLLLAGADPNETTVDDNNALHFAAYNATDPDVIRLLYEATQEPCAKGENAKTALDWFNDNKKFSGDKKALRTLFHERCKEGAE